MKSEIQRINNLIKVEEMYKNNCELYKDHTNIEVVKNSMSDKIINSNLIINALKLYLDVLNKQLELQLVV